MACRGFLQCLLKLLNLLLAVVGILLLVYGASGLLHWYQDHESPPSPPLSQFINPSLSLPLSPSASSITSSAKPLISSEGLARNTPVDSIGKPKPEKAAPRKFSAYAKSLPGKANPSIQLPTLWFLYGLVWLGGFITLVTFVGAIAAETSSFCCLSTYQFGLTILLLFQIIVAALIWLQQFPTDATGEFDREKKFVLQNLELCKLAGVCLLILQGTTLLLTMMLRALQDEDSQLADEDEDYLAPRTSHMLRQPLLRPAGGGGGMGQFYPPSSSTGGPTAASAPPDPRLQLSEAWRARMLEKYNLDTNEFRTQEKGAY